VEGSAGQISLAVTTLFWGAGATLQFVVLRWSQDLLGMDCRTRPCCRRWPRWASQSAPCWRGARVAETLAQRVAGGIAMGWRCPCCRCSISVVSRTRARRVGTNPAMGPAGVGRDDVADRAMAGYFVVPMNALLQHRGYVLLSAGHSIAVQNFNENLGILAMLACTRC